MSQFSSSSFAPRRTLVHQAVTLLAFLVVLGLDLVTNRGLATGALYAPIVMYSLLVHKRRFTLGVMLAALVAIVVGYLLSPPAAAGFPESYVWLNRIISVLAVVVAGMLAMQRIEAVQALNQRNLESVGLARQLKDQQHLLEVAVSNGELGGWSVDLSSGQVTWSNEVARLHGMQPGYQPASLDDALQFYRKEDRAYMQAAFQHTVLERVPLDVEAQILLPDGKPVWVRAVGRAITNENGRVVAVEGALQDISRRKLAELTERQGLQRFQQLAEAMPITVWTASEDGMVDYVTPLFFQYTGIPDRRLQGDQWMVYVHASDLPLVQRVWENALATGEPYEVEMRMRRRDGQYRWHLARAVRVHDQVHNCWKWFGSLTDIHDQRESANQTQELAQRLTDTLESITDAFFTLDSDWNFTYLNRQAEHLLHRSREDLIGKNVWIEFAPAVGTRFEVEYRRAMREQVPVVFEQFYPPLETWFEVHAYPSAKSLAVYFQDSTQRRKDQEQVKLLETAVSRLNDVVIITESEPVTEPGPRIVYVNDAFVRRTGYAREEVLGKTPRMLQGPQTSTSERRRIGDALRKWQPVRAELLNYTKAGDEYWVEIEIVPIADESGWYTHWVAVERDITERKAFEERMRHMQRMEAVGQLTGGVAHDFNNLLTVMLGNAELLTEQLQGQPALAGSARLIAQAGAQGAELTKRLLAFARQQPLDPRPIDVNRALLDVEALLKRTLGEHIELELVMGAGLWPALTDPAQLEDALLNLVLNARDAMPYGGKLTLETGNVWFSDDYVRNQDELKPGQYVLIAVSDTGCGIPEDAMRRIFEPFFTTKPKGKGTGLGLPMVFGFLKQSGGHMNVYSEPGQGTVVKLYLPRSHEKPVPVADPLSTAGQEGEGESILLVEDDALVRQYATEQLVRLGYRVTTVSNGPEALDLLKTDQSFDLLFTDVVMPGGMSGRQLADQAAVLRPGLSVLFTSGYTENAIVHHGRLDPGVLLLNKPYRRSELAAKVKQALQKNNIGA